MRLTRCLYVLGSGLHGIREGERSRRDRQRIKRNCAVSTVALALPYFSTQAASSAGG